MTSTVQAVRPRLLAGVDRGSDLHTHLQTWGALPSSSGAELLAVTQTSGLLGRGGAGFPAGRKLATVAGRTGRRVVVANGAEGEPASAKDRVLLTRTPHLVLDGIALAARAVGADRAHLVVHRGAGLAARLRGAVAERRDSVAVEVHGLPPGYVSSEESAVVRWLNGGDAKPAFTPPRPFEKGVGGRPTLVNNVETLAHLATIARRGAGWFREVGHPDEPGTFLATLTGAAGGRRVIELETGTPVGAAFTLAGLDLADASAVLVGGYFGAWLPVKDAAPLGLSQGQLRAAGASLGAGVLAGLPAGHCGIAETASLLGYLAAQSARQCGPCLNGLPALADGFGRLARGVATDAEVEQLHRRLGSIAGRGACRHPDGAVRLAASALTAFGADVAAHRAGRPCAGARRPALLPVPAADPKRSWR